MCIRDRENNAVETDETEKDLENNVVATDETEKDPTPSTEDR